MKKLSNTEVELKKTIAYKKGVYFVKFSQYIDKVVFHLPLIVANFWSFQTYHYLEAATRGVL